MGYLGKRPATQGKDAGPALKLDDISSDFNGLTTVFELTVNGTAVDPHINNIQVYLGGVHQIPGSSFSLSGSQIVFTGAPSSSLGFHGNVIGDSRLFIPDNDTVEPASFTANTRTHISGSFISGFNYSGTISGSSTSTASFGRLEVAGNTNLTGDIEFDDVTATGNIISTGANKVISGSITSTGSFGRLQIDSTASFGRVITSTADINGGTIDGITSLTAGGDLDIGAHDLRASTLTADSLTATRVPFAGTDGVLSDDSDLTFATATLSATNLTSTGTIKDFGLVSGSSVSTGSVGRLVVGDNIDLVEDQKIHFEADKLTYVESHASDSLRAVVNNRQMFLLDEDTGNRAVFGNETKVFIGANNNQQPTSELEVDGTISGSTDLYIGDNTTYVSASGGNIFATGNISGSTTSTGSFGRLQTQQANALIGGNVVTIGGALTTAGTLTTQNNNVTINAVGAARTLTLNESLTVGDGHDGTITFGAASKTLTIENTSLVNQDLTSDASPTFAGGTISGNLSVGGIFTAQEVHTEFESASVLFTSGSTRFGNDTTDVHRVTGSMDISGSLKLPHGDVTITDTLTSTNIGAFNLTGKLTAGSTEIEGSAFDINGGTIDGITSLTAGGDLDIGAHDFRAATLTADGLTAGRVVFAGTNGVLSDDSDLTFATATLSATNLTTTGTIKNMALVSGSITSTGSFGSVVASGNISTTGTLRADGNVDFNADLDVNGTSNLDIVDIDGAVNMAADLTMGANILMADDTSIGIADDAERIEFDGAGDISVLGANFGIGTGTIANESDHYKLKISGASGTGAGIIEFADGSNNIDGAIFSDGGNLFIVADRDNATADSSIRFRVDGSTERMRIASDGKVGIGTDSPTAQLSLVSGTYGFENLFGMTDHACLGLGLGPGSTSNQIRTVIGTTYGMGLMHTASATVGSAKLQIITTAENSAEGAAPTRLATFLADGKVGIGVVSPDSPLHISNTVVDMLSIFSTNDYAQILIGDSRASNKCGVFGYRETDNVMYMQCFGDSYGDGLQIADGGKVGIGTTNPASTQGYTGILEIGNASDTALVLHSEIGGTANKWEIGNNTSGVLQFAHSIAGNGSTGTKMVIDGDGNVGIGETDPSKKLTILGNATTYIARFVNDGNHQQNYGLQIQAGADDGSGTTYYFTADDGDGTNVGFLANTSGTFALTDASDESLKENIRDTEINGLDTVNSIKIRDFELKKSGITTKAGFVAQELKKSFAPATSEMPDGLMGVSREILVGVLVKAVQELSEKIDSQQKEIEELKK